MTALLTDEHVENDRLSALARVYQGMDRILTGGPVEVEVAYEEEAGAPAWSTGDRIVINGAKVEELDFDDIARLHGLNVHELAHVMYSPRQGTTFMAAVFDEDLASTSNLLEDQRIETLLTGLYPSTRPWLQATVARWILNNDAEALAQAYVLVQGRRYLPKQIRSAVRALWSHPEVLDEVDEIIDRYRLLTYPADYQEGLELTRRLQRILDQIQVDPQDSPDPFGHGDRPVKVLSKGRPKSNSQQRQARDRAEVDDEKEDNETSSGEGEQKPETDEAADSASPSQGQDADDPADERSGGQSGAGDDEADVESAVEALMEQAADLIDEVMSDREVRKEVQRTQRQISGRGAGDELAGANGVSERQPSPEYQELSRRFRRVLERLIRQADPGWTTRESSGRLNVLRWAQEGDAQSAFDRWDDGVHDAADLEVVILLDQSGSMANRIHRAVDSMWATKRALDSIDAATTVLCFSNESRTLYRSSEKASAQARYVYDGGGTNPVDALRQAAEIFQYSSRQQKILLVFTDGEWHAYTDNYEMSSNAYIERMNRAGVMTALGFIPDDEWPSTDFNSHGCKVSGLVNADSLVSFVQTIVTTSIRQRLSRR